jgi:hypothetical protein
MCVGMYVPTVTHENNFDLCSMCGYLIYVPRSQRKHTDPVPFHWLPLLTCAICNKPRVKFMQSSNQIKENKVLSCITDLTHPYTKQSLLPQHILNCHTWVTDHKHLTVWLTPAKQTIITVKNIHTCNQHYISSTLRSSILWTPRPYTLKRTGFLHWFPVKWTYKMATAASVKPTS